MTFDQNDPANMGRPLFFSLQAHIACVESLIRSDELQMAMQLCDMLPAWYLEPNTGRYPPELQRIKDLLHQRTYDLVEYANDWEEAACTREFGEAQWDNGYMFPRAEIITKILADIKAKWPGAVPWIFDLGCSHGNLPLGLIKTKHRFEYYGAGMNGRIVAKVKEWVGEFWREKPNEGQITILFCSEVTEHASRVEDILHSSKKIGVDFDVIVLSVPYCTLGGGLEDWNRRLGHVRTINADQFFRLAQRFFPGYKWELTIAPSMVIVGRKV